MHQLVRAEGAVGCACTGSLPAVCHVGLQNALRNGEVLAGAAACMPRADRRAQRDGGAAQRLPDLFGLHLLLHFNVRSAPSCPWKVSCNSAEEENIGVLVGDASAYPALTLGGGVGAMTEIFTT